MEGTGTRYVLQKIKGDKTACLALLIFLCYLMVAIGADVLAREDGWLIPWGPESATSSSLIYKSPGYRESLSSGEERIHILGTDHLGRDILARLVHGTRLALIVGLGSTFVSCAIALLLGTIAGYYGDQGVRYNWVDILLLGLGGVFMFMMVRWNVFYYRAGDAMLDLARAVPMWLVLIGYGIGSFKLSPLISERRWHLAVDTIVLKLLEVFRAVPSLFIIVALITLTTRPTIFSIVIIIGVMRWGTMTRLLRAEIMTLKQENFVVSARLAGLSDWHIIRHHLWPNAIGSMIVSACFYIGTAVLIESTLSFLGIGISVNAVSWGKMLSISRSYLPAWWLALFPGMAIFLLIISVSILGDRLRNRLKGLELSTKSASFG